MLISIKIAQRLLANRETHGFDYFPFDRLYLIPRHQTSLLPRIFSYYFFFDVTSSLMKSITDVRVEQISSIPLRRKHQSIHYPNPAAQGKKGLYQALYCIEDWLCIIPTYFIPLYNKQKRLLVSRTVTYHITTAITLALHNQEADLPRIGLHTPEREYPMACLACQRYLNFLAGQCKPAQKGCEIKAAIVILPENTEKGAT